MSESPDEVGQERLLSQRDTEKKELQIEWTGLCSRYLHGFGTEDVDKLSRETRLVKSLNV